MTKAINKVPGTTMISGKEERTTLAGSATKMSMEFFKPLLASAGGDTSVLTGYITSQLETVQESSKKTTKS